MARPVRPGRVHVRLSGDLPDVTAFLDAMRAVGFDLSGRTAPRENHTDSGYRVYRNAWPPASYMNSTKDGAANRCQAPRSPAALPPSD
jgi:hypothetical protein